MFQETRTFSSSQYFMDRGRHGTAIPIDNYINPHHRPVVSYYSPPEIGLHHYGERHPMKPHRLALTNALVAGYGLHKHIHNMHDVRAATQEELETYHDHDYVDFLSRVTPRNQGSGEIKGLVERFNCAEDCPIFADMYDFCRLYAGGSLAGARKLVSGRTDIAINWSGGLHHAKRGEASGFCYVNDIVLAILELLRYHPRVLYIDIDIHHGDGVELAFYHSNRVMTVSFHKYTGDFFPGTGKLDDNGQGLGKHFSLNVPLQDGIDDEMYLTIFKTVIEDTVNSFQPTSIVLQCGADSLGCDRLGAFNLSIAAHGECVNFVRKFNLPLLVLGGGGYTIKNVARCWTYETSILVGAAIPDELPATIYDPFFQDSNWKLHPPLTGKVDNQNSPQSLEQIIISTKSKLRYLKGAPSVMMQEIPPDLQGFLEDGHRTAEEKDEDAGTWWAGERRHLGTSVAYNEFYDGEEDNDADRTAEAPTGLSVKSTNTGRFTAGRQPDKPLRRGIGRGGIGGSNRTKDDVDEAMPDDTAPPPPVRKRGRGGRPRGRGRARARGGRAKAADKDEDPDTETDPDASMDVDVE